MTARDGSYVQDAARRHHLQFFASPCDWAYLNDDVQRVIAAELDPLSAHCLARTCRAEWTHKCARRLPLHVMGPLDMYDFASAVTLFVRPNMHYAAQIGAWWRGLDLAYLSSACPGNTWLLVAVDNCQRMALDLALHPPWAPHSRERQQRHAESAIGYCAAASGWSAEQIKAVFDMPHPLLDYQTFWNYCLFDGYIHGEHYERALAYFVQFDEVLRPSVFATQCLDRFSNMPVREALAQTLAKGMTDQNWNTYFVARAKQYCLWRMLSASPTHWHQLSLLGSVIPVVGLLLVELEREIMQVGPVMFNGTAGELRAARVFLPRWSITDVLQRARADALLVTLEEKLALPGNEHLLDHV